MKVTSQCVSLFIEYTKIGLAWSRENQTLSGSYSNAVDKTIKETLLESFTSPSTLHPPHFRKLFAAAVSRAFEASYTELKSRQLKIAPYQRFLLSLSSCRRLGTTGSTSMTCLPAILPLDDQQHSLAECHLFSTFGLAAYKWGDIYRNTSNRSSWMMSLFSTFSSHRRT